MIELTPEQRLPMGETEERCAPPSTADDGPASAWQDASTRIPVMACLVSAAAAWYLLKEFAPLLRPLLLATFLCYVILPAYLRLKRGLPRLAALALMVGACVGLLCLLTLLIHDNVAELSAELPRLTRRGEDLAFQARQFIDEHLPWLAGGATKDDTATEQRAAQLRDVAGKVVNAAAGGLAEAGVIGFYLLFLLLEAGGFPRRVSSAFASERAEQILAVVRNINAAMAGYLRVKVKASLFLAVPVALILWVSGVKFAVTWGVLTFVCNFIPYVGSIIALSLPIAFAFLQLDPGWQPVAAGLGVITVHLVMTYLVEPALVGKGVGLSPLVILASLAFWGLCWGLVGMFLAVPLTVMLKIVLENVALTRPFARLLAEE